MKYEMKELLLAARKGAYAVGSFSPRYVAMIQPVLRAAQEAQSPAMVQISQKELNLYGVTPKEFAEEYFAQVKALGITVPTVLHLDHTKEFSVIQEAIEAGFQSVMIDASEKTFAENVALSAEVVAYAHARGVQVEAELGKIGTTDFVETSQDEELFTDPNEAGLFVQKTGVDALAVSVGTAHGMYVVRKPRVEAPLLKRILEKTDVPLVLHGGSGVPAEMMQTGYGPVCKVNVATDLEQALLKALGRTERMTNAECWALPKEELEKGRLAVQAEVAEKMKRFLLSAGRA